MTISRDYSFTINAIKNCIGKSVLDIARIQSYYNHQEDTDGFGNLEITFDDNSILTLTGVGDAESIRAINKKIEIPEPFDVNDNDVCSWKHHDLKDNKEWKNLVGQTLKNAEIESLSKSR